MGGKPRPLRPTVAQLQRELAACRAENEQLRAAVKAGRRAVIEVQVLKGVISGLRDGVEPLDLEALVDEVVKDGD